MKNVVLLSTRRLPPAYFDTVRADLGGDPDLTLDVVGWVAPAGPVADKVHSFTLIGPGRMPVAPPPEPVAETDPTEEAPDAVIAPEAVAEPEAVVGEAEVAPAAAEVPADAADEAASASVAAAAEDVSSQAGTSTTPPAAKPRPTGAKRVVKAVQWRYRRARKVAGRMLPKAIKTSAPVKFLRGNRASKDLGKTYWGRILTRRDVLTTIEQADVVVALDAGAIWAGWNLGQRRAGTPVVLGIPAARRELDQLKAPAGNG
ncbi:hypothetical protein EV652_11723 [Kribbella steppae]|uniref:Uncharacterized protein n=1 Tax=Kribbella steppae TaxID=2512223 RepID=A0A4R2GZZ3_9ACTN|nr:hypothetical protein [Kribbella steppae]TCO17571.1 hypothetical protein EV652_11723 [Kribbella steppae]